MNNRWTANLAGNSIVTRANRAEGLRRMGGNNIGSEESGIR